ncbi:hypothetical protein M3Y94_00655300 [Aphelenchoides besseyi]|nr:hypothetical protein M3Y94_00655300 [Aphelenchoides besseyi]KAI6231178.1 hypothetical protein M3Y95_00353900 [Aphelenchoides besseyi]
MRLLSIFGFLFFVLFVVVLADYEKNDTNVDVHSDKLLLRDVVPPASETIIKCLCWKSNCVGHLQDCYKSCYQQYNPLRILVRRGCYESKKTTGWVQYYRLYWHFCNKDECNSEIPP